MFLLFMMVVIISLPGCGIFQTRKPQSPLSANGSAFIQPDDPTIVIQNMQNAIKNLNTQNYLRCLSSSNFEFYPSNDSQTNSPDVWSSWSITDEQTYFNKMQAAAQNSTGNQLQLSSASYENQSSTIVQYTAEYTLTVVHDPSQSNIPTVVTGKLRFIIEQDNTGLWYIQSWTDFSSSTGSTWSDLKAAYFKS